MMRSRSIEHDVAAEADAREISTTGLGLGLTRHYRNVVDTAWIIDDDSRPRPDPDEQLVEDVLEAVYQATDRDANPVRVALLLRLYSRLLIRELGLDREAWDRVARLLIEEEISDDVPGEIYIGRSP